MIPSMVPLITPSVAPSVTIGNDEILEDDRFVPLNLLPPVGVAANSMDNQPVMLDTSRWSPAFAVPSVYPVIHPLLANKCAVLFHPFIN